MHIVHKRQPFPLIHFASVAQVILIVDAMAQTGQELVFFTLQRLYRYYIYLQACLTDQKGRYQIKYDAANNYFSHTYNINNFILFTWQLACYNSPNKSGGYLSKCNVSKQIES